MIVLHLIHEDMMVRHFLMPPGIHGWCNTPVTLVRIAMLVNHKIRINEEKQNIWRFYVPEAGTEGRDK